MKSLNTHWERVRLMINPSSLRLGLVALSVAAIVFGGAAGEHWT